MATKTIWVTYTLRYGFDHETVLSEPITINERADPERWAECRAKEMSNDFLDAEVYSIVLRPEDVPPLDTTMFGDNDEYGNPIEEDE